VRNGGHLVRRAQHANRREVVAAWYSVARNPAEERRNYAARIVRYFKPTRRMISALRGTVGR